MNEKKTAMGRLLRLVLCWFWVVPAATLVLDISAAVWYLTNGRTAEASQAGLLAMFMALCTVVVHPRGRDFG